MSPERIQVEAAIEYIRNRGVWFRTSYINLDLKSCLFQAGRRDKGAL